METGRAIAPARTPPLADGSGDIGPGHRERGLPAPPATLGGLINVDAAEAGPLTVRFGPVFGVFGEMAAGCWPGEEITLTGFVASPEGLGGVSSFTMEPGWMVARAHFLAATDAPPSTADDGETCPLLPTPRIDPGGGFARIYLRMS